MHGVGYRNGRRAFLLSLGANSLVRGARANTARGGPPDLSNMHLVFEETFANLDVSASGEGTRWAAHTPWHGDFGTAAFADPAPGFPFARSGGVFHIEMRKGPDARWQSGLLASTNPQGNGFSLVYGYFELRAKLPAGPGVWPSFWLDSVPPAGSGDPSLEIDVFEQYGAFPGAFNSTVTLWSKADPRATRSQIKVVDVEPHTLSRSFHTYGASVDPQWIILYFDRQETWRVPTPPEHKNGLTILVDLNLGSGWPIDQTPSPSFMLLDYIRAYAPG
jgi:hypothetical protein